ncbi:MAG: FkbM family methyltransferase [Nitratireductor sp.]
MSQMNSRDIILKTKLLLPEALWRVLTKPASFALRMLPEKLKYSNGITRRANRLPYSIINENDYVFQIGAPADLLAVGRSRSAYFLNMVSGTGKVVVMEPDTQNCEALQAYADRNNLSDKILVINAGGWNKEEVLSFFESKEHPASAVLADLSEATPAEMKRRGYNEIKVPVTTVDKVIAKHKLPIPKLISITTNGAELQIMEGMKNTLKKGPQYISLAITGDKYAEQMKAFNFEFVADDDRGFTFKKRS